MTLGWFETHGAERSRCESNCRDTESIFDLPYLFKSLEAADEIATGWLYDAQCQKEWYEPSEQEMALWRQGGRECLEERQGHLQPRACRTCSGRTRPRRLHRYPQAHCKSASFSSSARKCRRGTVVQARFLGRTRM